MKRIFTLVFTLCLFWNLGAQEMFLVEDFESGLPAEWTAENLWTHGNSNSISSQFFGIPEHTNFMAVNDDAAGQGVDANGMLISPEVDLSETSAAFLAFEAFFIDGDYGADETAKVLVTTDGGATWSEVADIGGAAEWQPVFVSLDDYTGGVVQIAFEYRDGGGWNYGYVVDDVRVFAPMQLDAELTLLTINNRFGLAPFSAPLEVTITNLGQDAISSFDLNWSDGSDTYTDNITGIDIETFGSSEFTHSVTVDIADNNTVKEVEVWISNINGGEDGNPDNDATESAIVSGLSFEAPRAVIAEEATGTWCGWCPRGHVFMEQLTEEYEDFIGIAVHGGSTNEPMYVANYNAGFTDLIGGYPSGAVNRVQNDVDPSDFENAYLAEMEKPSPLKINLGSEFNEATRQLTVTIQGVFAAALKGDYRFNVIITEDNVTGSGDGSNNNNLDYDQVNYYANNANGPMGGYQNLPDPVPATQMVYELVARAILGDFEGEEGSLPEVVNQGATHSYEWTWTVPAAFNVEEMQIIGVLLDTRTGAVLNAARVNFGESTITGINNLSLYDREVKVSPNPFRDQTDIRLELEEASDVSLLVLNAFGQQVAARDYGTLSGDVVLPFVADKLESGIYFIHLRINEKIATKKVVLSR